MRPFHTLAAPAAAIFLAGCGASPTWSRVTAVRVDTRDAADPSTAYAEQVSAVLKTSGVEHKVVTYQFRYRTPLREEAITTRTAVIYRDGSDSRNPWWLAEYRLRIPHWLPGNDLGRQISFHVHGPAEVLTVDEHEEREGKKVIGSEDGAVRIAKRASVRQPDDSPGWFRQLFARHTPAQRTSGTRPARLSPVRAARSVGTPDARALALFRSRHGSAFDGASINDRVKMEALMGRGSRNAKAD
jgi:hypothetical protein